MLRADFTDTDKIHGFCQQSNQCINGASLSIYDVQIYSLMLLKIYYKLLFITENNEFENLFLNILFSSRGRKQST